MPRQFTPLFRRTIFMVGTLALVSATAAAAVDPGEILISEMNCVACHEASESVAARLASRSSPRLDAAHSVRVNPQWLRAFLENPQATQPGTLMPDLLAGLDPTARSEATDALTHYLVQLRGTAKPTDPKGTATVIEAGKNLYHTVGCVSCHAPAELPPSKPNDDNARAELEKLRVASVPLGALAKKYAVADLATFLQDPLNSRPGGRMPSLKLSAEEAQAIAAYLLQAPLLDGSSPNVPGDAFIVDPTKAARGREMFATLNCAACHPIDNPGVKAKPLAALNTRQPSGCLGTRAKAGVPRFEINDRQRVVMHAQIGHQETLAEPLTPEQQITRTMTTLNCYACHSRGRRGGAEGLRRDYFTSTRGDTAEDRIPPALQKIGSTLSLEALRAALLGGPVARPNMLTRMPLYGADNVGTLPELLRKADSP